MVHRGWIPDIVTDQTSAHDEYNGYVPVEKGLVRGTDVWAKAALASMGVHMRAMLAMQRKGARAFDYGNAIRAQAVRVGVTDAFDVGGFVPLYIRPQFCEGRGPFRWVALSGDPNDIRKTDDAVRALFPKDASLSRWLKLAGELVAFQGLPARVCWLGYGERHLAALKFNEMVREGTLAGPVVITRDHLDAGSVASPYRETEAMLDGSDAVADWPILNALLNTAAGADIVSFHHGGGVGMGLSLHANMHVVMDGSTLADEKARAAFLTDPGMGVVRHADAGYEIAKRIARERGVDMPSLE
jgi:urocanate hydratase